MIRRSPFTYPSLCGIIIGYDRSGGRIHMSAYFIANIAIRDELEYQKYLDRVDLVFEKFRGRYLAVDANPEVLEGSWNYSRVVLIEVPDRDSLKAWYQSPEYQEILKFRLNAAQCDSILVCDPSKQDPII
jgi:uncharacterized protein (DUF1330 family)